MSEEEKRPHKPFYEIFNRESCKGCIYRRGVIGGTACHYMLDNDEPRGCPADSCTKKRVKRG